MLSDLDSPMHTGRLRSNWKHGQLNMIGLAVSKKQMHTWMDTAEGLSNRLRRANSVDPQESKLITADSSLLYHMRGRPSGLFSKNVSEQRYRSMQARQE